MLLFPRQWCLLPGVVEPKCVKTTVYSTCNAWEKKGVPPEFGNISSILPLSEKTKGREQREPTNNKGQEYAAYTTYSWSLQVTADTDRVT